MGWTGGGERVNRSVGGGTLGLREARDFFFFSQPREWRGGDGYELFEEEVEGLGERRRRSTEGVEGGADER